MRKLLFNRFLPTKCSTEFFNQLNKKEKEDVKHLMADDFSHNTCLANVSTESYDENQKWLGELEIFGASEALSTNGGIESLKKHTSVASLSESSLGDTKGMMSSCPWLTKQCFTRFTDYFAAREGRCEVNEAKFLNESTMDMSLLLHNSKNFTSLIYGEYMSIVYSVHEFVSFIFDPGGNDLQRFWRFTCLINNQSLNKSKNCTQKCIQASCMEIKSTSSSGHVPVVDIGMALLGPISYNCEDSLKVTRSDKVGSACFASYGVEKAKFLIEHKPCMPNMW